MMYKTMLVFFLILISYCSKAIGQTFDPEYVLAKYVVAYHELKIAIEYEQRLEQRASAEAAFWRLPNIGDVDAYYDIESYRDTLLDLNIYIVYPYSMHSTPYILGIDDSLSIVRVAGFDERIHQSADTSAFESFNDPIMVWDFPLSSISKESVDLFVERMISILQANPGGLSLINNTYKIVNGAIEGEVIVNEISTTNTCKWNYRIPESGYLHFALVDGPESRK